jgi:hypothetical protein
MQQKPRTGRLFRRLTQEKTPEGTREQGFYVRFIRDVSGLKYPPLRR